MGFGISTEDGVYDFSDASNEEQFGAVILMHTSSLMSMVLGGMAQKESWQHTVGLLMMITKNRKVVFRPQPLERKPQQTPKWRHLPFSRASSAPRVPVEVTVDGVALREEIRDVLGDIPVKYLAQGVLSYRMDERLQRDFPFPEEIEFAGEDAELLPACNA